VNELSGIVYIIIVSMILGALAWTMGKYAWKIKKNPQLEFNRVYLLTMLLSMIFSVAVAIVSSGPFESLGLVPSGGAFSAIVSFAIGFVANVVINWPVTYLINKIEAYEKACRAANVLASPMVAQANPSASKKGINIHALIEAVVIVGLVAALLGVSVFAVITYQASISGTGSITGVGVTVYSDSGGQNSITSINWGNVAPSNSVSTTVYIKNTSNTQITLSIAEANWNPSSISSYLTLTWNYIAGTEIQPGALQAVTLTLAASNTAPQGTNFSFNIIITASG
jgi:hypothetical protein